MFIRRPIGQYIQWLYSQTSKTGNIQMSFNGWMVKQIVAQPSKQILLSNQKNGLRTFVITWMNLKNITQSERSQTQKATLYDLIYMTFWKGQNQKQMHGCWGVIGERRRFTSKGMRECSYMVTVVAATWLYAFTKIHRSIRLRKRILLSIYYI